MEEASKILNPHSEAPKAQKSDESDREREKSPKPNHPALPAVKEEIAQDSGHEKQLEKPKVEKRYRKTAQKGWPITEKFGGFISRFKVQKGSLYKVH